jgi:hypothetical protein
MSAACVERGMATLGIKLGFHLLKFSTFDPKDISWYCEATKKHLGILYLKFSHRVGKEGLQSLKANVLNNSIEELKVQIAKYLYENGAYLFLVLLMH